MSLLLCGQILLTWILFLPVPIINGFLREKWYKKLTGEQLAHQLGSVLLSAVWLLYALVSLRGMVAGLDARVLWLIGCIWLGLTVAFEFGLGRLSRRSWTDLLADYQIWRGRLWPLVLLVILLSPWLVRWLVG